MSQAYFVTGANRGIGYEIVKALASRPDTVIFAGVRNPATTTDLNEIASGNPNVHVLKMESTSVEDAKAAAKVVEEVSGGLDVVIANAGMLGNMDPIVKVDTDSVTDHLKVNAVGPIILFQALHPLLLKRNTRKFVPISSVVASLGAPLPLTDTAYGASKAALNFVVLSIHKEHQNEGFIAFPIHPGVVDTEMGRAAIANLGLKKAPVTPEQSAAGLLHVIDTATKEQSGRFLSFDGGEIPW
jgi:norsolorinic acid ketoreductase